MSALETALEGHPGGEVRLGWLDSLRGIAATSVFFAHFFAFNTDWFRCISHAYFHFGTFGVLLFLCISGYIIPFSLERQNELRTFWISRFFRLYPLYWFILTLRLAFLVHGRALEGIRAKDVLTNYTMLQQPTGVASIIGVSWTLGIELVFYFVASLLFLIKFNRNSLAIACAALVIAIVGLFLFPKTEYEHLFDYLMPYFGTLMFRIRNHKLEARAIAPVIAFAGLLVILMFNSPTVEGEWSRGKAISGFVAIAVFVFFSYLPRLLEGAKALRWLGKVSYSTYLVHIFTITVGLKVFQHVSMGSPAMLTANFVFSYCLTLAVSALTFKVVEAPAIEFGKRVIRRVKARTAAPAQQPAA